MLLELLAYFPDTTLALVDLSEENLLEVRGEAEALGAKVSTHRVDVASREQMEALPEKVLAESRRGRGLRGTTGPPISAGGAQQPLRTR